VLAKLDLEGGSLHDADSEADNALKLDPANRAAQDVMRQIEARLGR
jgi:hypothetical protein